MKNPVELAPGVYWVGALDYDIPAASGYPGTSYNAYLIIDDKITLVDGVKQSHHKELLENISALVDPKDIDYFIVNHVEPDHSSSMREIVEAIEPEVIYCSKMGKSAIIGHFHDESWPFEVVKTDTEISLGKRTVRFIETRMLHWPDSMFSFLIEDGILFSNDAFGQHLATTERFDDELGVDKAIDGAEFFYCTNLALLSPLITKLMKTMQERNLTIKVIAPDHGVMWRSHIPEIFEAYRKWSNQENHPEVVVVYDTKWKSTMLMAQTITDAIAEEGVPVTLYSLKTTNRAEILQKLLTSSTLVLGSPTINNGYLPSLAAFCQHLKGLKPRKKIGASFGSYGWGGEAVKLLNTQLDDMKITRINDGLRSHFVPDADKLEECKAFGREIARASKAHAE